MSLKVITKNRQAKFNYELLEKFEAGLCLRGSEVKSLRDGKVNLGDAYGTIRNGEVFLLNCHISPYQAASFDDHEPLRTRKCLLHKSEIKKLVGKIQEKGLTLVPSQLYFKNGKAKVELCLGRSKKTIDKRQTIKKRESDRQLRRTLKQYQQK